MKSACKIRLDVDHDTAILLDSQSKICNWLYNHLLEKTYCLKKQFIASNGTDQQSARIVYSKYGLRNLIPGLKVDYPFLKSVYSSPLKNAALRLSGSIREYQKAQKGQRNGNGQVGWPKFRSWSRKWFSLDYDEPWVGYWLSGRDMVVSLGVNKDGQRMRASVTLVEPTPFNREQVKRLRITKEQSGFYAVFAIESAMPETQPPKKVIAIDPNHKNLVYGVDTAGLAVEVENFAPLKSLESWIDDLKSKRDSCKRRSKLITMVRDDGSVHRHWEASRKWKRYNKALNEAYRLRREQTKRYMFTVANALCRDYDVIAIGNYTPHGGGITTAMRRSMNNQSLIGRFKQVLEWTCQKSGKQYVEYDEKGTTRTCHACQAIVKNGLSPDVRQWICDNCGTFHIRDENAALNGLDRVLNDLCVPRSGHLSVTDRCTWRVTSSEVITLRGRDGFRTHCQEELKQERGSS